MPDPSTVSPHRPPIRHTGADDPARAAHVDVVIHRDEKSRAAGELAKAYRELSLAQRGWQSAIETLLRAHQSCWEYEAAGKATPTAVKRHLEQAEHDFKLALADLRFQQGKCWGLERIICQVTAPNGGRR